MRLGKKIHLGTFRCYTHPKQDNLLSYTTNITVWKQVVVDISILELE
jgi:hypothetical protein